MSGEFRTESLQSAMEVPESFDLAMYVENKDLVEKLLNAVENLRNRNILKDLYMAGLTSKEAAEKYGLSVNGIDKIKAAALQAIRQSELYKKLVLEEFNKTGKL